MSEYSYPSLVTALALLVYFVITLNVGRARQKYDVKPPAISGDPNFERAFRVQQNTLEQLVFFLPMLWLFSVYFNPLWGGILGGVWVLGRILYAWGYYQEANRRFLGFALSSLSGLLLLAGAFWGIAQIFVSDFASV
ncbi:MAG: MAPEG family protein [Microcystaceae cyanobacterium]